MENGMFDENVKMGPILYDAKIGLWHIEMDEGKPERMYANRPMLELLGLDGIPTPEECYRHWHSRIEKESLGLVEGAVQTMAAGQHGEISYPGIIQRKGKFMCAAAGSGIWITRRGFGSMATIRMFQRLFPCRKKRKSCGDFRKPCSFP